MAELYRSREELINTAMSLWKKNGSDYRTFQSEYDAFMKIIDKKGEFLDRFEELGIKVPEIEKSMRFDKFFLREYPEITYLGINDEKRARDYLKMLDSYLVLEQLREAEKFNDYPIVIALREKLRRLEQIFWRGSSYSNYDDVKKNYKNDGAAINPSSCKGGKHSHGRTLSYIGGINVNEQ